MTQIIGQINHPKYGMYYIHFDRHTDCYGITKENREFIHCAYASLESLFKTKGF